MNQNIARWLRTLESFRTTVGDAALGLAERATELEAARLLVFRRRGTWTRLAGKPRPVPPPLKAADG
ncbi:MAG: hypothetical protein V3T65_00115 [Acidobacteriota bacterium]